MQTYSVRELQAMLGMSRSVISGLVASGFVTPSRGKRNEYRFSFQDVVLLRTAHGLQSAHIPPRKIRRSLQRLKATLPEELPLSGLRITAVGNEIAVRQGRTQWHADSGQLLMEFELVPAGETVDFLAKAPAAPAADGRAAAASEDAQALFERGVDLEARDPVTAEAAYRRAIALAPHYVDPYLNLGVMLCDAGRCADAVSLYRAGLHHQPDEGLLHFNLAIALEDLDRIADALAAYGRCIELAPGFADAHYNAARLHERLGQATQAIRHYSAYRRLQR
jgi:tetratricopeptide (TPR) repeat protein